MNANEKNRKIFGSIKTLEDEINWTVGISNMMEFILWDTKSILGISKTQLIKMIVEWSDEDDIKRMPLEDRYKAINKKLQEIMKDSECQDRYEKSKGNYCNPREALRRARFFSEDYLNKQFDIFLNLCSSAYIDEFYSQFTIFKKGNKWSTYGNSIIFGSSTEIDKMQMDNLAYNANSKILIANELKLGGKKNKDQILKYCYMYIELINKQFIKSDTNFLLLFIGDKKEIIDLENEIRNEIEYIKSEKKLEYLLNDKILEVSQKIKVNSLTWDELIHFNKNYVEMNNLSEVETKLLLGFNEGLKEKAFLFK